MKRCPVCQQDYPDDSRFCGRCGRELPSADKPVVNGVPASVTMTVEDANAPASLPSMPPVAPAQPYPPTAYPPVAPSVPTDPYAAPPVPPVYPPQPPYAGQGAYTPPGYYHMKVKKPQGGLAIAAFVVSLVSLFMIGLGPFNIGLYVGLALTIAAWVTHKPYQGRGLAIAALVLSLVTLLCTVDYSIEMINDVVDPQPRSDYDYDYDYDYDDDFDYGFNFDIGNNGYSMTPRENRA